ncbi:MAG: NAD(P)H-dependent flavin oxidoreductase [Sphingorhabdus sp.]
MTKTLETRITRLLGIRHPIIQGGMQWVGFAELASAVSNAGGLGMITALSQESPDHLKREIARCQSMTDQPYGVNLTILPKMGETDYDAYCAAIIASGVKVVETAGRSPANYIPAFHNAGIKVIHKCTSVRHALSAEKAGVDAISIDSFECAGHPGEDDVGGLVLIPAAVDALRVPVLACGGIADGRGLAAALVLGAAGVTMGTRFCATREAPIHDAVKRLIVGNSERDTHLIFRQFRNTARVSASPVSDKVVEILQRPDAVFEDIAELVRGQKGRETLRTGDLEHGLVWASQAQGLIHDIPSCEALLTTMVEQAAGLLYSRSWVQQG